MEYAFSENTDIKVSRVHLGCMSSAKQDCKVRR